MSSRIESVSLPRVVLGIGFVLFALALVELGYYRPSTAALAATVLMGIVLASQGLKPFGDTIAYQLLQAAAFAFWGTTMITTVELTVIPVVFAVVGLVGILNYGRRAVREGVWITID